MSVPEVEGDDPSDEEGFLTPARRSQLRRAANVLGIVLLLAFVLPFVAYAVPQLIGAEYSYVVLSGSMQPTLAPGDVTYVDAVEASAIEEGDVVNFKRAEDDRTTTHRVIEIVEENGGPAFRTEGDNNEDPDQGLVTPDELRGRVMQVGGVTLAVPLIGYLIQFSSGGLGFVLLFVVPVTLLVANEVWAVVSAASADDDVSTDGGERERSTGGSADEGEESSSGVSFRPAELRLGAGVLAAFVLYSVGVAVTDPGPVTIGVAGSAAVALLLVGGLYAMGSTTGESADAEPSGPRDPAAVLIEEGALPDDDPASRESVSSLDALVDLAETTDRRVRRDPTDGTYHLAAGNTLYVYAPGAQPAESATDGGAPAADASATDGPGIDRSEADDD